MVSKKTLMLTVFSLAGPFQPIGKKACVSRLCACDVDDSRLNMEHVFNKFFCYGDWDRIPCFWFLVVYPVLNASLLSM